jgi:hypothetical protein
VQIKLDRGKPVSKLEVDIEIPNGFRAAGKRTPRFDRASSAHEATVA